jgi:hypothetical protein
MCVSVGSLERCDGWGLARKICSIINFSLSSAPNSIPIAVADDDCGIW